MENEGWEKKKINTVNRYRNRGKYDYQTVNTIVDESPLLHVSFSASAENGDADDTDHHPFPVILPMLGCTSAYPDADDPSKSDSRVVYLHGYISSRMIRFAKDNDERGIPICVCATLLDGVVLALTPNHHSCNYRSALIFGHASIVTDEPERLFAMQLITNNLVPSRWQRTRYPNATELKSTGILRVEIASASAKVRAGTTGEDRKDLKDDEMKKKVWAGVVPAWTHWGAPIEAPTNTAVEGERGYIEEWVKESNGKAEKYAYAAAK